MNAAPNGREIFLSRLFFRFTAFVEKKKSRKKSLRAKKLFPILTAFQRMALLLPACDRDVRANR